MKSYALIMNLSANTIFLKRCQDNNINFISLNGDETNMNSSDMNMMIESEDHYMMNSNLNSNNFNTNSKSFTEYLVRGKNVSALFMVLMNQILLKENSYDIVSSYSFENCSMLHTQSVVNNELFANYEDVMHNPLYETCEDEIKLID